MKLRHWRKQNGMTLARVANALGVHEVTVNRWETDARVPTRKMQARVLALTDGAVTPNDWMEIQYERETAA